jgi:hypothetical protein
VALVRSDGAEGDCVGAAATVGVGAEA